MTAVERVADDAWCERKQVQGRTLVNVGGRWTVFTLGPLEKPTRGGPAPELARTAAE